VPATTPLTLLTYKARPPGALPLLHAIRSRTFDVCERGLYSLSCVVLYSLSRVRRPKLLACFFVCETRFFRAMVYGRRTSTYASEVSLWIQLLVLAGTLMYGKLCSSVHHSAPSDKELFTELLGLLSYNAWSISTSFWLSTYGAVGGPVFAVWTSPCCVSASVLSP
jgi:hypothetical protein